MGAKVGKKMIKAMLFSKRMFIFAIAKFVGFIDESLL
jgi:hypothetical protein